VSIAPWAWRPQLLPGGDALLFTLGNRRGRPLIEYDEAQIVVQSLTSGERTTLVESASDARYLPSGHLVFAVSGSLFAIRFDPATRKIAEDRVPILGGVRRGNLLGLANFDVSDTGSLVYLPGPVDARAAPRLVSVSDRRGMTTTLKLPPATIRIRESHLMACVWPWLSMRVTTPTLPYTSWRRRVRFAG
jgi:hypothetical protein